MMDAPLPHTRGFSLLELLVAISIFALLSLTAYSALEGAVYQKRLGESQADELRRMQVGLLYLERDLQQAVNRSSSQGLTMEPALEYNSQVDKPTLRLSRIGWSNPLGRPRGNLQRLVYVLDGERLYRRAWGHLDSLQGEAPQQAELFTHVQAWELRLLDGQHQWQTSWPQRNAEGKVIEALPLAVEIRFTIKDWGEMRRLIKLAGG